MRPITKAATALSLALIAAPVAAQAADPSMDRAVATLNDPAAQDRMADTVTALVGALMQLNVGPIIDAAARVDPQSRASAIPPDATLGEIVGRGDPRFADNIGDDVRAGTRVAGRMASTLVTLAPVFKDMARDLAAQWEAERRDARRR